VVEASILSLFIAITQQSCQTWLEVRNLLRYCYAKCEYYFTLLPLPL